MCSLLTTDPCPSVSGKKTTMHGLCGLVPSVAAFLLNTIVPCNESPWVLRKRKSYSVGLASPLSVFHSEKILQCVPSHFLQPQLVLCTGSHCLLWLSTSGLTFTGCEVKAVSCLSPARNASVILWTFWDRPWKEVVKTFPCFRLLVYIHTPLWWHTASGSCLSNVVFHFFFPFMLFKLKQTLILCILETGLFFFCNVEGGKWPGKDSLSVAMLGGSVWT